MKIGIIGGGAAGLAAAFEILRQGHQAVVYERAPFLGGQASTFLIEGTPLERGYHHLFTSDTDMIWLINELGLGSKLTWIPSKAGLFYNNRIWDFTTPLDLLRFGPISLLDRFRLGLTSLYLQRVKDWRQFETATAAEWLPSRVGQRAYQALWEPLLRGKFGQHYQEVGMTWFWGKMALRFASRGKRMVREYLGYPMGSFGEVFDTLGEKIVQMGGAVNIGSGVQRIRFEDDRATGLEIGLSGQETHVEPFDAIIATVPSNVFPRLVPPIPTDYLNKLTGTTYLAAVLVVLTLDQPLSSIYWLNVADRDIPFVGVIEQTNFLDPSHYGGKHVIYLANYLGKDSPLFHLGHQELLETYRPHLQKLNPKFHDSWIIQSHYHREEAAQPVIGKGYSTRIPAHQTPFRGVYLANTTQIFPEDRGTNYSVRLGRKVARLVLQDHGIAVSGELPPSVIENSITSAMTW